MPANNDFKVKQGLRIGTKITSYNSNTAITNGQLLIGNTTSSSFDVATITQGANLTITNAGGAITIAANANSSNSFGTLVLRGPDGSFTSNIITATLYGSANTVTTNAQSNITSVGTLTSLSVSGNTAVSSQLLITDTNTLAGPNASFSVAGTTGTLSVIPNISAGSFNSLHSTGDIALLAKGANNGNVGLSIIPWAGAASGIRIGTVSNVTTITLGATTTIVTGNILSSLANGVATIGNATAYFGNIFGTAMLSRYADVAENYAADLHYEPGTVVEFGGANEITLATNETPRVAGIISTKPAYLMNMDQQGDNMLAVALQGRVPCKVTGVVHKGDMMVSAGNGYAKACTMPAMGTVIGKALENYFSSVEGVIEVVVGRL